MKSTRESVKNYYGKVLRSKHDLKTTACCAVSSPKDHVKPIIEKIHEEVRAKNYGCGFPFPKDVEGKTILDMGSGTGRDVYVLAALAGKTGKVIGIDMTPEQLTVATSHLDYHQRAFNGELAEIEFRQGMMEETGLLDNSIDLVISNCVFNLSPIKEELYQEIHRVLKPGGEVFFSDIFSSEDLPDWAMEDDVLLGECLGGAITTTKLSQVVTKLGFTEPEIDNQGEVVITNEEVKAKLSDVVFSSCLAQFKKAK